MAIDESSSTTTRLLTLLNVSATKAGKRKRVYEESKPSEKLNKKRAVVFAAPEDESGSSTEPSPSVEKAKDYVQQEEAADHDAAEEDADEDEQGAFCEVLNSLR